MYVAQIQGVTIRIAEVYTSWKCMVLDVTLKHESYKCSAAVVIVQEFCSVCRGVSSTVRRCVEKETQKEYAVKMIDLTQEKDNDDLTEQLRDSTKKEMDVLRVGSEHPNISKNQLMI